MDTYLADALPVSISGPVGIGKANLLDLLHQAYGDQADLIQTVRIGYWDASYFANIKAADGKTTNHFSYWDPKDHSVTTVLNNGKDIGGSHFDSMGKPAFRPITVDAAHFKDIQIQIGDNIMPNVAIQVAESSANGTTVWHDLDVTTVKHELTTHGPSDHAPTAADVVSTAEFFANVERGVVNTNDCHWIATTIAASAGATLDPNTQNVENPRVNEEGGFWRIAYRGTDGNAVDDWQTKVQAGDIVRMGWKDHADGTPGGYHTTTVIAGLNADGQHPGQIKVVDNGETDGINLIGERWVDYDNDTKTNSITVYRLTTDDKYLIDQSTDGNGNPILSDNTILGTNFNDLIKGGDGSDMLRGGDGNDELQGGNGGDTLIGGAGNDTLDGGDGVDIMRGGSGDDTYIVNSRFDVVDDTFTIHGRHFDAGGIDEVKTTLGSYFLENHKEIENLTYIGSGNFNGSGNGKANVITGGDGADHLSGGDGADVLNGGRGDDTLDGGTGADRMNGGAGNDVYIVDSADDFVSEMSAKFDWRLGRFVRVDAGGIDEIKTTLNSYSLDRNAATGNVENLTFTGHGDFTGHGNSLANDIRGGDNNDHLFGMDGADRLFGGNGADTLDGGTGADWMAGGAGNDVYYVDSLADTVTEQEIVTDPKTGHLVRHDAGGIDEIRTTLSSFSLDHAAGNIENLTFNGTGNFEGHGNGLDNVITGGHGADKLFGGEGKDILNGGTGADHLTGGTGADKFVFALGDNGVTAKTADHITDFEKGDMLDVSTFVATHSTIEATRNFHGNIAEALSFANAQLAAGHNAAGSAVLADSSSHNVYVFMDQNGDHKFESAVVLDHADSHMSEVHSEIASHQLFI
jgi:Ca2+-binding RTX toxin-like protein